MKMSEYSGCTMKIMRLKNYSKMRIVLMQLTRDHHAKHMMITSLWYVVCRAHKELCKVLVGCLVEFYTHLVCFCLFSRSLEAVDCSADPGKFRP